MRRFLIVLCVLLMGFTISPASISFEENVPTSWSIRIINDGDSPMSVVVTPTGDLAQGLRPQHRELTLQAAETRSLQVSYVPVPLLPGQHQGGVLIEQVPPGEQGSTVQAISAARQVVTLTVPQEGSYLEARLLSSQGRSQEAVALTVAAHNVGTEVLQAVTARIEVRSPAQELLETLYTDAADLQPGEQVNLVAIWHPPAPGTYSLEAIVSFADKTLSVEEVIDVGALTVRLEQAEVRNLRLGEIAVIEQRAISEWNKRFPQVTARFDITGERDVTFSSAPVDLAPRGDAILTGYWDTDGFPPGRYELTTTIQVHEKLFSYRQPLVLGVESAETGRSGLIAMVGLLVVALLAGIAMLIKHRTAT